MTNCMFNTMSQVPANAEGCAKLAKLPWDPINKCASGAIGNALMKESIRQMEVRGVRQTPTVFVDNVRIADTDPLLQKICQAYKGPKPKGCQ